VLLTYPTSDLLNSPALYAMYGGRRSMTYVGAGGGLRRCVESRLLRRDSAQTTGASVVSINADHIRELKWWEHRRFVDADVLQAAVIVADEVLEPALRNREPVRLRAREISGSPRDSVVMAVGE